MEAGIPIEELRVHQYLVIEIASDQAVLSELVTRLGMSDSVKIKAMSRIDDPALLVDLGTYVAVSNKLSLSQEWLHAVSAAAKKTDPSLLLKVSGSAKMIIRKAHNDRTVTVGGRHNDIWQRVPHVSSDCHEDNTVWTQRKGGGYGEWGYHADAPVAGREEHQDSSPLESWDRMFRIR